MVEFDKGLQRKKRTKESVKSTALGGGIQKVIMLFILHFMNIGSQINSYLKIHNS